MSEGGLITKLAEIVGAGRVRAGEAGACCVVAPRDVAETAAVVALAAAEGGTVTARGAGTGLWNGAVAAPGGIVISTEGFEAGPEIHGDDLYAVVGAGVTTAALRRRAEAAGLLYPVDPASEAASTVGGNVAEGAAGMHGLKYGATRNYVLGLEVVTPGGRVVTVGGRTVKNVAGYDITRLVVGSRGALGIVTSAIMKLLPLPQERRVLAFGFGSSSGAAEAAGRVLALGGNPAALEILDEASLSAAAGRVGGGLFPGSGALLIAELDGASSRCRAEAAEVADVVARVGGVAVRHDATYPAADGIWALRRSVLPALAGAAGVRLWDLRLAPGRMPDLFEQIRQVSRRYEVGLAAFGHAGEGLLHMAAAVDWADTEAAARVDFAVYRLASLGAPLGLEISEGGGVGAGAWPAPGPALAAAPGSAEAEVVRRLKAVFDPAGVMRPGQIPRDEGV